MKDNYKDLSGDIMVHVCKNPQEEMSNSTLLAFAKGEPMVENATDGVEDFLRFNKKE